MPCLSNIRNFFELEGATLEFHPKALQAVAKKAAAEETGARALRSVMENLMLDLMFELPDLVKDKKDFLITEEMVLGSEPITEMVNLKKIA